MSPIDGLEGFENLRQYGVSLALLEDGKVCLYAARETNVHSHCSRANLKEACHLAAHLGIGVQDCIDTQVSGLATSDSCI